MKRTWFAIKMLLFFPILVAMGILMGFLGAIVMWAYHWMNIGKPDPGPVLELECQCPSCKMGYGRHGD